MIPVGQKQMHITVTAARAFSASRIRYTRLAYPAQAFHNFAAPRLLE
jgi:hypothetical protein